jgi:hypothetical protein
MTTHAGRFSEKTAIANLDPIASGLPERIGCCDKARFPQVMRERLGFGGLDVRKACLNHASDLAVNSCLRLLSNES